MMRTFDDIIGDRFDSIPGYMTGGQNLYIATTRIRTGRWAYNKMIYITKQFICADSWRGGDAERPAAACYFMHCQSALYAGLLSIRGVSSPTLYRTQTTRFNTIRHSTLRLIFERTLYVFSPSFYLHLYSVFILQQWTCLLGLYWTGLTLLNGSPFLVHFFLFILGRAVD